LKTIRIVAADDSAVMRSMLVRMFAAQHAAPQARMELCVVVPDGASCLHAVRTLRPDVVLLDLHMPGLGGLEAIVRLRHEWPGLPIIICSSGTEDGAATTLEALSRGASDYVTKPTGQADADAALVSLWTQLAPKILALGLPESNSAGERQLVPSAGSRPRVEAIGIGISTGGPPALERLLPSLPEDFPVPVLVVQHMPRLFTSALAARLDRCCALHVREATVGTSLLPGTIWIAPGDSHMEVKIGPQRTPYIVLHQGEPVYHCRPAVDVLFRSLAQTFGAGAMGLVLTGMGADGLEGSHAIVNVGGTVLAQDEASSAVWGMPGRVVAAGLARAVLPLEGLGDKLISLTAGGGERRFAAARQQSTVREVRHGLY
jgi:two-component system, chemotaxis family, protein-glutamate methylesterase/glutaminase